ncbi:cytochrome P450 [Rhizoctonia solani]|nr:cytochrome P450 [Rhizoctonia solani]
MNTDQSQLVQCFVALGALAFAFYVVPYLLDPYEYRRRFPGPPLAGVTNWWMSSLTRTGHHSEIVKQLHDRYGTFVRLGPNHISIADPDALEIVYGHGSGLLKSEFYRIFQNGPELNVFNTSDRAEHSRKRKRLANIFSPQNVSAFEPRVRSHIRQLCAQLDLRCKEAAFGTSGVNWGARNGQAIINICAQFSYLAFDIIGDLAMGSSFELIQAQKDSSLAIESVDTSGEPQRGTVEIPVVETIAGGGAVIMAVGVFPSWTHRFLRFLPWNIMGLFDRINIAKLAKASVDARIKRGPRKGLEDGKRSLDLIDKLLESKDEDGTPLSINELYAEALALLIAGSDTTSNTLSSLCYHLAIHPEVQRQLQAELDQNVLYDSSDECTDKEGLVVPPYDAVVQYDDVKNLPYLNACIKEVLRIHSTVGTGLPRVVPPGKTLTVSGQTFRAGSVISVPSYTTNRSSVWGNDAGEFRPERWLDGTAESFNKYFVPFSVGPRACVGRNLAYMDLMLIAATIFRRYQVEALPTTKMVVHEAFVRETAHCEVAIKRRSAL